MLGLPGAHQWQLRPGLAVSSWTLSVLASAPFPCTTFSHRVFVSGLWTDLDVLTPGRGGAPRTRSRRDRSVRPSCAGLAQQPRHATHARQQLVHEVTSRGAPNTSWCADARASFRPPSNGQRVAQMLGRNACTCSLPLRDAALVFSGRSFANTTARAATDVMPPEVDEPFTH